MGFSQQKAFTFYCWQVTTLDVWDPSVALNFSQSEPFKHKKTCSGLKYFNKIGQSGVELWEPKTKVGTFRDFSRAMDFDGFAFILAGGAVSMYQV